MRKHVELALQVTQQSMRPAAPLTSYAIVSLSNVTATTCQYEALKYVSFPVQTLESLFSGLIFPSA